MSIEGGTGCEEDSNFHQSMLLQANDNASILNMMKQKTRKYTDHHVQNEILQIMADEIRNSGYFVLECDEVTDASNKE